MAYPICHLLVLGSACFNPLLYGWLNDNFRREFIKALCCCSKAKAAVRGATTADARTNGGRSMATGVVGGAARPPRRCRRRPSQVSNDIELEPRHRYGEQAEELVHEPDILVTLVNK